MGQINSAHHQSAELVAKGFVATCMSPEGVVEGIERLDKGTKPYLQLVQWHPERMTEPQSLFSKNIKLSFLEAVRKNKKNHA
jgi:putative glutamine amidotransferase